MGGADDFHGGEGARDAPHAFFVAAETIELGDVGKVFGAVARSFGGTADFQRGEPGAPAVGKLAHLHEIDLGKAGDDRLEQCVVSGESRLLGVSLLCVVQGVVFWLRYYGEGDLHTGYAAAVFVLLLFDCFLTWFAHRRNIVALLSGEEHHTSVRKLSHGKRG